MNKQELINWCMDNLEFSNCPDDWHDTYIDDILNGYNGSCHLNNGKVITYQHIRDMFKEV